MKGIVITVLVLLAASAAWRDRAAIDRWLQAGPSAQAKPIVFDNGTVREPPAAASQPFAAAVSLLPGMLRKCVRGGQTTYTDIDCPNGFQQRTVAADRVSIVDAPADGSARASAAPRSSTRPAAQRRLHDALDLSQDSRLRERVMERAIDAGSR